VYVGVVRLLLPVHAGVVLCKTLLRRVKLTVALCCVDGCTLHQVIAVCKSADLLLMVLDATKPWYHKEILTRELESVGMRLNR